MAIEMLSAMEEKGIGVTLITFATILQGLYKKGRSEESESYWDERVTKKGCVPDFGAYNVRLTHIHSGKVEGVKRIRGYKVFKECVKLHKIPDFNSLKYLAEGLTKNGHTKELVEDLDLAPIDTNEIDSGESEMTST
ncbi:Hypothetical predicted protein [Olea europaea subsp. europaea]|uniref:Pentatricopeptide repeat-containing protein n=1 Tax=Olea europaea subsp. europaea TaxID=158383 RepID=A0A8S0SMS6_OLEEU|nr:Hypothetical predicted protein [Olea europaea subsp. europaea]